MSCKLPIALLLTAGVAIVYATLSAPHPSIVPIHIDEELSGAEQLQDDNAESNETISRSKRQLIQICPSSCYSTCGSNNQCSQGTCQLGCCCPPGVGGTSAGGSLTTSVLATACGGGPAVAACINGLCGQGFTCTTNGFCCVCGSGNATGPCVNSQCPTGNICNLSNNMCCPLGSGTNLNPCVSGICPTGFVCGAGNLCYSTTTTTTG